MFLLQDLKRTEFYIWRQIYRNICKTQMHLLNTAPALQPQGSYKGKEKN